MSNIKKCSNFIIRFLFSVLLIGLSLKQIQEKNNLIKAGQDTVSKAKNFFYMIKFYDLNRIYGLVPILISVMYYSLMGSGILLMFNILEGSFLMNFSILVQLLLVNNIFLDSSSKCYLMASAYVGIYGVFQYFRD